jgi:hypothetical protein
MPKPSRIGYRTRCASRIAPPKPPRLGPTVYLGALGGLVLLILLVAATRRAPAPAKTMRPDPVAEVSAPPPSFPALAASAGPTTTPPPTVEKPGFFLDLLPSAPVEAPELKQARRPGFKRMHDRSIEEILAQVEKAPGLNLDRSDAQAESKELVRASALNTDVVPGLLSRRPDLAGLPLRSGPSTHLTTADALHLAKAATELKEASTLRLVAKFAMDREWLREERIPGMMQVLMADVDASRLALIKQLARIEGEQASAALAQIALFDPDLAVRRAALTALIKRPADEYRGVLLHGFEHPWTVVNEHAAEALAALERTETVPALLALLDRPDPQMPSVTGGTTQMVRELVRVDHKRNCLLCHPVSSQATDTPRGRVPPLVEPASSGSYYSAPPTRQLARETFVRADVTFLKQDYSVELGGRRNDLFVRERPATKDDVLAAVMRVGPALEGQTGQRRALLFALRELTGEEPDPRAANWKRFAEKQQAALPR